jgi:biopolymer transport protein ExbD
MKTFKNIALGIIALCLAILAGIAIYDKWSDYKRAKEAEAALVEMEQNKPPRFVAKIPPGNADKRAESNSLVVSIDSEGRLRLNAEEAGTIDDLSQLRTKLAQVFQQRREQHIYKPGLEDATNVPEEERIEMTVLVKAPHQMKYREVKKVLDAVKDAGANPVGLQLDELAAN